MTIQEQIKTLRSRTIDDKVWHPSCCLDAANTMEKLLAVYEAAKDFSDQYELVIKSDEYKGIWTFLYVHNQEYKGPIFRDPSKLRDALEAVK